MLAVPMPPQTSSHLHPPATSAPTYSHPHTAPTPTSATDARPKITSRPKLSLQTTSLPRTFGRSTTGLSLSVAAASPTVNNTFKNAYYENPQPASAIPASSPVKKYSKPASPFPSYNSGNPYQQPLGVKSILRNSPLDSTHRRSGSGVSGSRRVFFPVKKQVSYQQPLEEEIRTKTYVARHSDLIDEEDSQSKAVAFQQEQPEKKSEEEGSDSDSMAPSDSSSGSDDDQSSSTRLERRKRKSLSAERQVRAVALLDGLEGDNDSYSAPTPQTPRQSRVKRRREWKWTLGSVEARNEAYGLPQTPEDAAFPPSATAATTTTSSSSTTPERQRSEHDETGSMGSCESDWTSTSTGSSSAASASHTNIIRPDESKMYGS